jgi:hypothetical protein
MRYSSWFLLAILVFFLGGLTGDFVHGCFWTIFLVIVGIYKYIEYERNEGNMPYKGQRVVSVEEYMERRGINKCYWLNEREKRNLVEVDDMIKQIVLGYMFNKIDYEYAISLTRCRVNNYNMRDKSQMFEVDPETKVMYWKVTNKENPKEVVRLCYPIWGLGKRKNEDDNNEKYKEI